MATTVWDSGKKASAISLSGGDLVASMPNGVWCSVLGTVGRSFGAYYFELVPSASTYAIFGLAKSTIDAEQYFAVSADGFGYRSDTGQKATGGVFSSYGSTFAAGDVIGVCTKNGKVWFAINNVWQGGGNPVAETGEAFSGLSGLFYPAAALYTCAATAHFSAGSLTYSPPSGYQAWDEDAAPSGDNYNPAWLAPTTRRQFSHGTIAALKL